MTTVYSGPTAEQLAAVVLDPPEVAADRTAVELNTDRIRVDADGIDWGEAAVEGYMAQLSRGEVSVDQRIPNRRIVIPLMVGVGNPEGFALAKAELQAKVALFQSEGGWLRRGDGLYAEIEKASLVLPDSKYGLALGYEADVVLTLEALPDLFGDEVAGAEASDSGELIFLEPLLAGDYPCRTRLEVSDDSGQLQRGLLWGVRCRHYDPAATAELAYQAGDLTPLDAATTETRTGAFGDVVRHASIATAWTPVMGTGFLTHTGTYRVWARVYAEDADVKLRFVSDVGDLTNPKENIPYTVPAANSFHVADLGEIRLDKVPTGDHRWQGQIQAKGAVGGETVDIDRLWFQPLDEGAGRLVAPFNVNLGLSGYLARDEFNQTAGNLAGKTASVGGGWTGSGDSDDFVLDTSDNTVKRTAVSDSAPRKNNVGAVTGDVVVQVDIRTDNPLSPFGAVPRQGVVARAVDANNYFVVWMELQQLFSEIHVGKVIGGTLEELFTVQAGLAGPGVWYQLRLAVTGSRWAVQQGFAGSQLGAPETGEDDDLAGTLATGVVGIYDYHSTGTAVTRGYNNLLAWEPVDDAVLFPMQSAELRTDGMFRKDSTGGAYGPVSHVLGDLVRLPPSGLEDRPVEVFLKWSRGDFAQIPDSGIDAGSARTFTRASWLFPPG